MNKVKKIEADYLIIGAGATAMSFVDTLLTETNASFIIVDKFQQPGGHWNHAYPFVRLHQPATFYGVSSTNLGDNEIEKSGFNKGLMNLSTGSSIRSYYKQIMYDRFLPSRRVSYFPLCEYQGNGQFNCIKTGESFEVTVNKKIVDATHMKTKVPSTHTPNFNVDSQVKFIPINDLINLQANAESYVIIGGGKTGIDACLWLLENNVDPNKIQWIISRDSWFTNRKNVQPNQKHLKYFLNDRASQLESLEQANSVPELFELLEKSGVLLRLDKQVNPNMYHGATVSQIELEQLRCIKNIVRLGRVRSIENDKIILDQGDIPTNTHVVHVDCSANALSHGKMKPIFNQNTINIQSVRAGQLVFSAALIAHIEATFPDDNNIKNEYCMEIPIPDKDTDWIKVNALSFMNHNKWSKNKELNQWLYNNRLDGFSHLIANIKADDKELQKILERISRSKKAAMNNLNKFASEI